MVKLGIRRYDESKLCYIADLDQSPDSPTDWIDGDYDSVDEAQEALKKAQALADKGLTAKEIRDSM